MSLVRDFWCLSASACAGGRTRSIPHYLERPTSPGASRILPAAPAGCCTRTHRAAGTTHPAGSAACRRLHYPLVSKIGGRGRFYFRGKVETFDSILERVWGSGTRLWSARPCTAPDRSRAGGTGKEQGKGARGPPAPARAAMRRRVPRGWGCSATQKSLRKIPVF